ncbi:flagellar hook capping FlgD N-terminal domain-containing protein [Tabrizicola sp.]|jgi:flagellar basal-body rod modification protein FlgD|uniref:flagellar hook capping FlgD N-terminal domain-containing protein n=1 Tax=Tabrizicola sp. TaxID=2005166 RepID=UPI001A3CA750|nr:flagellar hook capping FlgD N-terminal domain-containing protein [Tabrizicola sp.]MBL9063859.1 flagellar hook assembly protein FlgD [Tabrizicola sp.]
MDVTSATSATATTATASASAGATAISSDFNTFLRMLTVQMQNQDPLNPIDSADYAVQLATFSGVEQQVKTNQLLADMQGKFQQLGMAEMASWIGKEARSAAPVSYDGSPVTLSPNPAVGANRAVLVVKDAQGNLVSREEIPVSAQPYQWLGAGIDGSPLPAGTYSIELESLNGETVISSLPVEHYARVIEARGGTGGTVLVLEGGAEVLASDVTALREPQG